ncbi:Glycosyltransferase [Acidilobus saccharovorans 345-15]|uniref:Glycosyltransferase n=1 Tax=Acidilobus saccharovorans (strain DSM 16705 / JCM 18335 / VKM B-2471 / 345-15) TaxID=666510 RepID=D9Q191_ACIS3|nr:Glycosyltransferase [Acidilobus saccharovorans 345-15]
MVAVASQGLCLYGTVLNSVDTVERSIRSVYRPDAEIVVVDGGSRDSTYERLLEIAKDYNVKVYRLPGSSRGRGRDYALRMCPEGSYAAYFDLDDEYNAYFHRAIEWGMATGSQRPLYYLVKRDYAVARGGWRDLNVAEDVEFFARVGLDFHVPVLFRRPLSGPRRGSLMGDARRYVRGTLGAVSRSVRNVVDLIRGNGFKYGELASLPYIRRRPYLLVAPVPLIYTMALVKGIYRYDPLLNNHDLMFKYMVSGLVDPIKEVGADDDHAVFSVPLSTASRLGFNWVVAKVRSANLKPYTCSQGGSKVLIGVTSSGALASVGFRDCDEVDSP